MALHSGIPPSVWAEEGERAIVTACDLIAKGQRARPDRDGPQMSG
ncbi:hypothetical protein ACIA59_10640 [Micromonospora haikouensis]